MAVPRKGAQKETISRILDRMLLYDLFTLGELDAKLGEMEEKRKNRMKLARAAKRRAARQPTIGAHDDEYVNEEDEEHVHNDDDFILNDDDEVEDEVDDFDCNFREDDDFFDDDDDDDVNSLDFWEQQEVDM